MASVAIHIKSLLVEGILQVEVVGARECAGLVDVIAAHLVGEGWGSEVFGWGVKRRADCPHQRFALCSRYVVTELHIRILRFS